MKKIIYYRDKQNFLYGYFQDFPMVEATAETEELIVEKLYNQVFDIAFKNMHEYILEKEKQIREQLYANKGRPKLKPNVLVHLNQFGEMVEEYTTLKRAEKKLGITKQEIQAIANGRIKSKKYILKWKKDLALEK